jgi:SprT protein
MDAWTEINRQIPPVASPLLASIVEQYAVEFLVKNKRKTKHGDYRRLANGRHLITLNRTENPQRFLITLIHELAHLVAFKNYGARIKPHGLEWKSTYKTLMLPFLQPTIFPEPILGVLARHMKNPKATTDSDFQLVMTLKTIEKTSASYVFELPEGAVFKLYNGKVFTKGPKMRSRYECIERATQRRYRISPHAEVEPVV